jgi:hypothetical protein
MKPGTVQPKAACPSCGRSLAVRADGRFRVHRVGPVPFRNALSEAFRPCPGSLKAPQA